MAEPMKEEGQHQVRRDRQEQNKGCRCQARHCSLWEEMEDLNREGIKKRNRFFGIKLPSQEAKVSIVMTLVSEKVGGHAILLWSPPVSGFRGGIRSGTLNKEGDNYIYS